MTYPPAEPDLSAVCPYLGLADDADSHATYATEAHRCYRMPNPTRIAQGHQETYCLVANHVTCPVYTGEGISRVAAPAVAGAGATGARGGEPPVEPATTVAGPPPGAPPKPGQRPRPAGPAGTRPKRTAPGEAQLRPRPRAGGISMPAMTIGLFALAIVLIAIAFLINEAVDDDGGAALSEADRFATQNAGRTTPGQTQTEQPGQTPAGTGTPGTQPAGATTPGATGTPGSGDDYTVQAGDTCFGIAEDNDVTLAELLDANDMTEDDCAGLQEGQKLKLP